MPLIHHELCFGCGRQNLFGLLADVERRDDGSVAGRCFLKQDHQGPEPGFAHPGLIAAALLDAMALLRPSALRASTADVHFSGVVSVGTFLELVAGPVEAGGEATTATATALVDGAVVARATAVLGPAPSGEV